MSLMIRRIKMFNIQKYMDYLYHKIVIKNGKEYPVWVCKKEAPEEVKSKLKRINKGYRQYYKIPLIGFEK